MRRVAELFSMLSIVLLSGCQALIIFFPPASAEVWIEVTDTESGEPIAGASVEFVAIEDVNDQTADDILNEKGRLLESTSPGGCVDGEDVITTTHVDFLQICQRWPKYWLVRIAIADRMETLTLETFGGSCGVTVVSESTGETIRVRATFAWAQSTVTECLPCSYLPPHFSEGQDPDRPTEPCIRE